jgi:hypothetical protein
VRARHDAGDVRQQGLAIGNGPSPSKEPVKRGERVPDVRSRGAMSGWAWVLA